MRFINYTTLFSLLIALYACNHETKTTTAPGKKQLFNTYRNSADLDAYLSQFGLEKGMRSSDTVFFIPLNSCDKCVNVILNSLMSRPFSGWIVFGGKIGDKPVFKEQYDQLSATKNCLADTSYMMYKYNLDVYEPALLILDQQKPVIAKLDYQNWKAVCLEIGWKAGKENK